MKLFWFKKRQIGYTPWVAKKAPLMIRSLNANYVKVTTALLFAMLMFLIGSASVLVARMNPEESFITNKISPRPIVAKIIITKPIDLEQKAAVAATAPPLGSSNVIAPAIAATPPAVTSANVIVPAIPMTMSYGLKKELSLPPPAHEVGPAKVLAPAPVNDILRF